MSKKFTVTFATMALLILGTAFGIKAGESKSIILATTTSVADTGLLDVLIEAFQKKTGSTVKAVAVGTGQALEMGRLGEADLLWVHSPADEKKLVEEGFGINRITFMHNDFVVLGPESDPAELSGTKNAAEAFKKISAAKAPFVSRGDNSGTHKKEKLIWQAAGVLPGKDAYMESGQGMAKTVLVANEKQGYVLADRSTYLSLKKAVDLQVFCEGDPALINYYSLILINPQRFPKVNAQGAGELYDFLLSKEVKEVVENFGKEKYGGQLFFWDLKD